MIITGDGDSDGDGAVGVLRERNRARLAGWGTRESIRSGGGGRTWATSGEVERETGGGKGREKDERVGLSL